MQIVILERNTVGAAISVDCFNELGEFVVYDNTSASEIPERVKDADIIIANKSPLNESTLKDASNVKLICELATGYDNIDIDYCNSRNIKVCNVKGYSTPSVAQHTFALLFYILEKMNHYDNFVRSGEYSKQDMFTYSGMPFNDLEGKTWGIVGMGSIGSNVARIATAFGCNVIHYSVTGSGKCNTYPQVSFDELLAQSDIVSLHCPKSELTADLFDYDALSKMKKSAILINVARGGIVNDADLYRALIEEKIYGAGLDVVGYEPIKEDNPLLQFEDSNRLIITPHMAWASTEAKERLIKGAYENVKAFMDGKELNVVN